MKTNFLLPVLALALLCGCAHVAQHVAAPSTARLDAASAKLGTAVTSSRAAVATVKQKHEEERERIVALEPRVAELLRVAPVELRPQVLELAEDVTALHEAHEITAKALESAVARLAEADAAKAEAERFRAEYTSAVDAMAVRAQKSEDGWAKDSEALAKMRRHWFIGWLVLVGGVVACVLWTVLKGGVKAAAVAAKVGI